MSNSENPFEPQPVFDDDRPKFTLHPVRGVVWAAFWGSPLAAGIVLAINYNRLGKPSKAFNVLVTGALFTMGVFALLYVIPDETVDHIPNFVFVIPQLIVVYLFASTFQRKSIEQHESQGGHVASAWPSVGIGFLCLPVVFGALIGVDLLFAASLGTPIAFGNDEIYISEDATEEDARKLAEILTEAEYFGDGGGCTVTLRISADQSTILFVLLEGAWEDPESITFFRELGEYILEEGFPAPLEIQLSDQYFVVQKTLHIE